MECGSCGSINRDAARFCLGCGAPLLPRCPSCGNELPLTAKFCDSCGTPLHKGIPAPEGGPTRKIVTVLFTDLTGSTALGERMDPESFRAIMTPVYASMRNEVEAHGGVVTKFVGDGVMAAFGVPDIREDDAMRAVDAAVAMQQAIARLSLDLPVVLSLKVGVNTGEVVLGVGDEDIVGDCVNVASRLEGAAAPGEVLVGEETWRLTRGSATYEPVAPLSLKGKAQPVPAYRLVSLERTQEAGAASFVGRYDELAQLRDAFEEAVASRSTRLATIIGSPGLGKTRLARELGVSLAARAIVVETRCDVAGSATFDPVAEALRVAADIPEAATSDDVHRRLLAIVPEDDIDRKRIAERAGAILGAGEPGSTEETFWAIRRLVEIAASTLPLVIIIDDLHWAEPLLLDLVEHLVEWNKSAPVLMVVTGRPELRELRPRMTDGAISLEGLDGRATEALACSLLGTDQVPRELLARLPASTEGNPLFVREFVRMLVDDGVLRRYGDAWIATIDVDAIEVPPTIHSLLAARVDRLTPHERAVLELASVIGKEFYMGAIAELAPPVVQVDLSAHLESLRRKELVEPAGTYWIDEPVFRFHHALIRDAAYRRLLKESRAELHERVASWLERKTGGLLREHDDLIGYHLEQAHECRIQLGSPKEDLRELGRRAGVLLASAARTALDLDDLPSAAGLSGRALARLEPDDPDRPEALLLRCEALLATGDVSRAASAVGELESVAASSPRLSAWATCFAGELATITDPSRLRETEERVAAAAAELVALGDRAGAAKAYTVQAVALAGLGRVGDCEAALDRALNAAREAGDRRRVTAVLGFAPVAALWGPSPVSRAGGRCLDIIRLLRITTGSPAVEATSERCQAVLEAFRGRAEAARRMLVRGRAKVEQLGLRQGLLETELFFGIVELVARDPIAAEQHLREAHDGFFAMGNDLSTARAAALLARALLALDEEDEAAVFVTESEHLGGDDLKNAIAWRAVRAELLARRGEFADAKRLAEEAVRIANQTDALIDHADACMALADVCRRSGDTAGARSAAADAATLYERKGATAYLDAAHDGDVSSRVADRDGPTNACVALAREMIAHSLDRDFAYLRRNTADDGVIDDRRLLGGGRVVGVDACVRWIAAIFEWPVATIEFEVLAIRGDDLMLGRAAFSGRPGATDDYVVETLNIWQLDADSKLRMCVTFDGDALDLASAELERMSSDGSDGVESSLPDDVALLENRCVRIAREYVEAMKRADEHFLRANTAADATGEDRRPIVRSSVRGRDEVVAGALGIAQVGDFDVRLTPVATRGDNIALVREHFSGKVGDVDVYFVWEVDEAGFVQATTVFDEADIDDAFALIEDRFIESLEPPVAETVRLARRYQEAANRFDEATMREILAPDVVAVDHRPASWPERHGPELIIGSVLAIEGLLSDMRMRSICVPVATERFVVNKLVISGRNAEGADVEFALAILTEFAAGRMVRTEQFAPDQLDRAVMRAHELSRSRTDDFADTYEDVRGFVEAYNARDWDRCREIFRDDIVYIDHRPASHGELHGAERVVEVSQTFAEVATVRLRVDRYLEVSERGVLMELSDTGSNPDGGEFEIPSIVLVVRTPDRRVSRIERYPEDEVDEARNRYEALCETPRLENAATRWAARGAALMVAGDWEAHSKLLAPDYVFEDRRSGLRTTLTKAEAAAQTAELAARDVDNVTFDVIAVRGERLAVIRSTLGYGGYEVDSLILLDVDPVHGLVRDIFFDVADLTAALVELDERYMAGEGAQSGPEIETMLRVFERINARRWDDYRAMMHRDFHFVDHRAASLGEIDDVDALIRAHKQLTALIDGAYIAVQRYIAIDDDRVFVSLVVGGRGPDGGSVEMSFLAVVGFREGLVYRNEFFPNAAIAEARHRFDEIAKTGPPANRASAVAGPQMDERDTTSRAVRAVRASLDALVGRNWVAYAASLAPTYTYEDRRSGLAATLDRDETIANAVNVADLGVTEVRMDVIDSAPRHLLARMTWVIPGQGFDAEMLIVQAIDDEGRLTLGIAFDPDDRDASRAEFDRRANGENRHLRFLARMRDAIIAHDASAFRALYTPECVWDDRRRGLSDYIEGIDARMANFEALASGLTDVHAELLATRGDDLALLRASYLAADDFRVDLLVVQQLDEHDRLVIDIGFDDDDLDAAYAALDARARQLQDSTDG